MSFCTRNYSVLLQYRRSWMAVLPLEARMWSGWRGTSEIVCGAEPTSSSRQVPPGAVLYLNRHVEPLPPVRMWSAVASKIGCISGGLPGPWWPRKAEIDADGWRASHRRIVPSKLVERSWCWLVGEKRTQVATSECSSANVTAGASSGPDRASSTRTSRSLPVVAKMFALPSISCHLALLITL